MIKNLRLKFVLVFLLLVVSVFITSSCYAVFTVSNEYPEQLSRENIRNMLLANETYSSYADGIYFCYYEETSDSWRVTVYENVFDSFTYDDSSNFMIYNYKENHESADNISFIWSISSSSFSTTFSESTTSAKKKYFPDDYLIGYTDLYIYDMSSNVLYEPTVIPAAPETTFDYTIVGTKRGQVKLSISGLDSSLNMYGYVGCENIFEIGDLCY